MAEKELLSKIIAQLSVDMKAKKDEASLLIEKQAYDDAFEALSFAKGIEHSLQYLCNLYHVL